MCDYSLELYRSRPAIEGEKMDLHRFPSGTMGFTAGSDKETATCVLPGSTLQLENISTTVQKAFSVGPVEIVTMTRLQVTGHAHRDAVTFTNGRQVSLQSLNAGMTAVRLPVGAAAVEGIKAAVAAAEPVEQTVVAPVRELVDGD